jgi:predicted ATP-dependent serine protease
MMGINGRTSEKSRSLVAVSPTEDRYLNFNSECRFLTLALSQIKRGEIVLLAGKPGASKSTIGLLAALDASLSGLRTLVITTEMSRDQIQNRIFSLARHLPVRKCTRAHALVEVEDKITDLQGLPNYMVRQFGERANNGKKLDLLVIDSLHGSGVSPNSGKIYQRVYQVWNLCRAAKLTVLGITHVTKANEMAGPSSLAHSSDAILHIHAAGETRWLTTIKNRNGRALGPAIALKITPDGRLVENQHSKPMTGIAKTILPGAGCTCEVQVALGIPRLGQQPSLSCPSLPRGQIAQLLKALVKLPVGFSPDDFSIEVCVVGNNAFRKSLHLPIALATVASFTQKILPGHFLSLGEIDLNLSVRPLPDPVAVALAQEIDLGAIPQSTTLLLPHADLLELEDSPRKVRTIGIRHLLEAVTTVWPELSSGRDATAS